MPARRPLLGLVALALALAWIAVPAPRAWACSCAISPHLDDYRTAADVVFTGELIWRDDSVRGESRLHFSVEGVHKGAAASNQVVVTPAEVTACGVNFAPGGPWLIFAGTTARSDFHMNPDEVFTTWCDGSTGKPAPDDWASEPPGPEMDTPGAPIPPVVWWLSGAGVLLAVAGVIMVYRYRIRRR